MPRKAASKTKTTTKAKASAKAATKAPAKQAAKITTKSTRGRKAAKVVEEKKVVETPEEVVESVGDAENVENAETTNTVTDEVAEKAPKRKRTVPTRELVLEEFATVIAMVNDEIEKRRSDTTNKSKGVRFLRSLNKRLKTVCNHAGRVMNNKKRVVRKNNTRSGFLKPVKISSEMASFTGWNPEELKSRVDVTKYICNYIKTNDLQNPENRREILADSKLSNLLGYDSKHDDTLTYYRLQTHLKKHFVKDEQ